MFRFFGNARDPLSSYTHFLGALLSGVAMIVMVGLASFHGKESLIVFSALVFGLSLIALYSASAYYHFIPGTSSYMDLFRKLDHTMIYVLIAGSYTPIVLGFMERAYGLRFIGVIWLIALGGIAAKIVWLKAPRILYTLLYVLMGWAIVFDLKALSAMPMGCLTLIAMGGLSYTVGAVIYMMKKPNITASFGFHELFHIFIMIGSAFHVWAVIGFIV